MTASLIIVLLFTAISEYPLLLPGLKNAGPSLEDYSKTYEHAPGRTACVSMADLENVRSELIGL